MHADVANVAEKRTKTARDWSWANTATSIMLAFVAGLDVQQGIVELRTGKSDYEWISQVLIGLAFLLMAITSVIQPKAKKTETPIPPPQADSKLL